MTKLDALKKLYEKVSGEESNATVISEAIDEIAEFYEKQNSNENTDESGS